MNSPRPGRGERPASTLRDLEREIAALLRQEEGFELARALARRAELLDEVDESDEAAGQLDELIEVVARLEGREARRLLIAALAQRIRLGDGDEEGRALADTDRALELLEGELEGATGADRGRLRDLEAELSIHRGHLLAVEQDEGAADVLRAAVELADALETSSAPTLRARARRELAVARAQEDLIAGLSDLEQAEALFAHPDVPASERALLLSTRAEMLANAGRFDDALAALARASEEAEWVLAQRAATLDAAGREGEAYEVGARLVERLKAELDPEDAESVLQLAEVLLAQARRSPDDDARRQQAEECVQLVEGLGFLPTRGVRLLAHALEALSVAVEGVEVHQALSRRAHLLERLYRERGEEEDRTELIRSYLLDGDSLMRLGEPREARRAYRCAVAELRAWDADHPVVQALLPLAYNALAQSFGAAGLWLSARGASDEAVGAVSPEADPATLGEFGEVFLFRAVACVTLSDAEGAVEGLRQGIALLLGAALTPGEERVVPATLVETVMDLCILQAEVLVDHLDRVDEAVHSYDQALALCELGGERPDVQGAILGAKAAMLSERERPRDALPLLERCVELFQGGPPRGRGRGDLAYALVNLASTLNRIGEPRDALGKIQEASGILTTGGPPADPRERRRRQAIRALLYHQRGEALLSVGHPLLAADEFGRAIELCGELVDGDVDSPYETRQRLPLALLRRARAWLLAGDHGSEAAQDLAEARGMYERLLAEEGRPEHRRRLDEVEALTRELRGGEDQDGAG